MIDVAWNGAALITMSWPSTWAASAIGSVMSTSNARTPRERSGARRSLVAVDDGDVELGRGRQQLHDRLADLAGADQRQLRGRRGIHAATVHHNSRVVLAWHGRLATNGTHRRRPVPQPGHRPGDMGLFVGLAFLLLAAGLFGTLLGVRSELIKLPTAVSSLISASYYIGFLVGSRVALSALGASATSACMPRSRRCCRRRCWPLGSPSRHRRGPGCGS